MIELPESHSLAGQLATAAVGKQIRKVTAGATPHGFTFYEGDPAGYPALLTGKTINGAAAAAGWLELRAEESRLLLGDGINLRYLAAGEKRPAKHQLLLELEDDSALVCTVQMYGGIWAYPAGTNTNPYYLVTFEKPSPLTDEFDAQWFEGLFSEAKPTLSVKGLLATEQRIPGLGNGCLQDILFHAGLHPKSKALALDDSQKERLFHCVKDDLRRMTELGGRDTEKDLYGVPGGYPTVLSKNTLKKPCPVCGGEIVRQPFMGGNVYFCPSCQPLVV